MENYTFESCGELENVTLSAVTDSFQDSDQSDEETLLSCSVYLIMYSQASVALIVIPMFIFHLMQN